MPQLSLSLTAGGSPYNFYRVLTGQQTTGVTLVGAGVAYKSSMPPNPRQVDVLADAGNAAKKVFLGDGKVAAAGPGWPMAAGNSFVWRETAVSLMNKWMAVDTDATVVHIMWDYA
jgi:hypothetical protein